MGDSFSLTKGIVLFDTGVVATLRQPMSEAIDVGAYKELSLQLNSKVLTGALIYDVKILTSMQNDDESTWFEAAAVISGVNVAGKTFSVAAPNVGAGLVLLRYIRWEITNLAGSGSGTGAFTILGIAHPG